MRKILILLAAGTALASCASSNSDLFGTKSPETGSLRFESSPPGAEARLPTGQSCRTPCALAVPAAATTVTFILNGYLPQSVAVEAVASDPQADLASGEPPGPRFDPNPVVAELEAAPAARKPPPRRPPRPAPAAARPAAPATSTTTPARSAPAPAPAANPAAPWPAPASSAPAPAAPWPAPAR